MKTYNSTRQVKAAKIEGGGVGSNGMLALHLSNDGGHNVETVSPSQDWIRKHAPDDQAAMGLIGGYFVEYMDGYTSFCPAEAFERDHQPVDQPAADDGPDGMVAYALAMENPDPNDPNWPLPSFDARDWAKAFCKHYPSVPEDEALGWFANALMRGHDEHARRHAKEMAEMAQSMGNGGSRQEAEIRACALGYANVPDKSPEDVVARAGAYLAFLKDGAWLEKGVQALRDQIAVQSSPGNYTVNEYMRGMANGLILALSNFTGEEPRFHEVPAQPAA